VAQTLVALVMLAAWPPARLSAQSDGRLIAAIRLAQDGRSDSARAVVQQVLSATAPTDSLYPQALLAAATVASTAPERERHLQRIVVEYPSSEWADDALLGLAQLDYAAGDLTDAARNLERLRSDVPDSPLLPAAAVWAARVYFDRKDAPGACRWIDAGLARADLEQRNQLQFYQQRCTPSALADTAPKAAPVAKAADSATRTPAAAPRTAVYRVQIVATPGEAAAKTAAARLKAAGVAPRVVQEGRYYKVRGGSYATRAEAMEAAKKLRARLGGAPFVVADST
jgi:septal ring-binding cell division protein DamX